MIISGIQRTSSFLVSMVEPVEPALVAPFVLESMTYGDSHVHAFSTQNQPPQTR